MKAFLDYKERSTVWKTDHVLAVCGGITRTSGLEYIFTRKCPLPSCRRSEARAEGHRGVGQGWRGDGVAVLAPEPPF
jgi:hypothetical protein